MDTFPAINPGGLALSLFGSFIQPLVDGASRKAEVEKNRTLYVERLAVFTQKFLEPEGYIHEEYFQ